MGPRCSSAETQVCHRSYIIAASMNRIGGLMVSVLASSAVDRGFEPRSGQTKDFKFGFYLLLRLACIIKEKEQRLVGSESE